MNVSLFPSLSICSLFFLAQASADTLLLNNGKSQEGKVIFEDATYYLLEVQVSEGIKDEMKFLKSDVKSITKETPDIEKFEKLKELASVPDLLGVAEYEARVKKVQDFIKGFPASEKLKEAQLILDSLTAELEVVRAGGMKLSGKMVTAEQYASTAYAYDQLIAVQKINRDISYGNFLGALRLFSDYESKFANGKMREELVPKIKQVLTVHQASLTESLAGFDARLKAREAGLARMSPEDKLSTERALDEQMANVKTRYDAEKATKNTWITPDAYLKESLVEALRQVDNEIKRLSTPPKNELSLISLEDSYREAYEKLPGASPEEQKTIFEKLKRERMPDYYVAKLKDRATADQ
ncbi:MAG: PTPDL family protein [Verrucomicrobiota bacterium]